MFHSIISARMVLNMREAADRLDDGVELAHISSIQFGNRNVYGLNLIARENTRPGSIKVFQ